MAIGVSLAFLASYSLKSSQQKFAPHFDNFDFIMMVLSPAVSFLMAESFSISGLLALTYCAFFQAIYAKNNLGKDRQ
jgi:NhaP-type Na+/H+ or K+/H+ antiporter